MWHDRRGEIRHYRFGSPDKRRPVLVLTPHPKRTEVRHVKAESRLRPPTADGPRTLGGMLEAQARATPEAPFVVFDDLHGHVTARTYREFDRDVNRTAHLLGRLGVGRGDTITLLLSNRLEFLALWFGAAKLGAVIVPVNTAASASELEYLVAHSESRLVFTEAGRFEFARQVPAAAARASRSCSSAETAPRRRMSTSARGWRSVPRHRQRDRRRCRRTRPQFSTPPARRRVRRACS